MAPASRPPSGAAAYKKKDGVLAMSEDRGSISWSPAAGGGKNGGPVKIEVGSITNLQQTPANNPKVMLKIFAQQPAAEGAAAEGTVVQYVFSFTSGANARPEADAIKEALSTAIQATKASQTPTPAPGGGGEGTPAAMAIASAMTSSGKKPWDDDDRLKGDAELQQSLLKSDPTLQKMFMESLHTKPEAITSAQFMRQFWSARIPLLRAHAIERAQTRGSYNVLSTLKPRVEDNVTKMNISKEQIQLIFNQHPLVKRVYDENVPKMSEQQFWSRFFQSRLFKKLRGERATEGDASDSVLDKYLKVEEYNAPVAGTHAIPRYLDMEGNEQNNSQKRGNRPDVDMRPAALDKIPIIRTLNGLSEKLVANVAPSDVQASEPIGMDEETYNELQLRDLRGDEEQNRIILNIRDQSRFFSEAKETGDEDVEMYSRQDPAEVLLTLQTNLNQTFHEHGAGAKLGPLVEPEEGESSDDEQDRTQLVGSKVNLNKATSQVLDAIRQRRTQTDSASSSETCGIPGALFEQLTLTHATTIEFLHQFWRAFLSGSPERAGEIASLAESLNRALDRIRAIADDAEADRKVEIEKLKQQARDVMKSTGRKTRPDLNGVGGGEKVVNQLFAPTIKSLENAIGEYKKALAEATKEGPIGIS
ncbi:RNA polymerase II transcription factor B subunit 1 [Arachnomyces sp. PD_36]|nr:RNA polymerase II transcription factor B subunit 1 [Arachnomyces sp. PD_36]